MTLFEFSWTQEIEGHKGHTDHCDMSLTRMRPNSQMTFFTKKIVYNIDMCIDVHDRKDIVKRKEK